jgi:predicted site-specific integrase-resolvase
MNKAEWLSITDFAGRLGMSRHTVEGLVKNGGLKVFNISPGRGRPTYRIPASEIGTALSIMQSTASISHGGESDGQTEVRDEGRPPQ